MAVASAVVPVRLERGAELTVARRPRRWPVESTALFVLALVGYVAVADLLVIQTHYMNGDAYARVANAYYVIGTRDPHLGAIGFVWPPIPSLAALPFLILGKWFPFLVGTGFAGSMGAAFAGAGTVVLLNLGLRRAGVYAPIRYVVLTAWILNPMLMLYDTQAMSEGFEIFFLIAMVLVFLRWCDTNAPRDLTLLGIVAGLNSLAHTESVVLSIMMTFGVFMVSLGRKRSWREVETRMLMFGIPFAFLFGGWILAQAVLLHDPLYFVHSIYANGSQAAANGGFGDLALTETRTWTGAATYLLKQAALLYPAALVLAALVIARLPFARNRRAGLAVLLLGVPVPAVEIYELHSAQLALDLRYSMWIIAWGAALGLYLVWDVRNSARRVVPVVLSVAMTVVLLLSNVSTFDSMNKNAAGSQEYPVIYSLENHVSITDPYNIVQDLASEGANVAAAVDAVDTDHGLIVMDTFEGFNVFLNTKHPTQFVVTSDYEFEAAANQPTVYHVEYFLVPEPVFNGALDRLNQLYPLLWRNGATWAREVAYIGGSHGWKMFRITGPTGGGAGR